MWCDTAVLMCVHSQGVNVCVCTSIRNISASVWSPDDQIIHLRVSTLSGGGHGASGEGGGAWARARYAYVGGHSYTRKEYEQAVKWYTRGAEAGLPKAMYNLGYCLDQGQGVAAPDYPAAVGWFRRAADAGHGAASNNLCQTSAAVGPGRECLPRPPLHCIPSFRELNRAT